MGKPYFTALCAAWPELLIRWGGFESRTGHAKNDLDDLPKMSKMTTGSPPTLRSEAPLAVTWLGHSTTLLEIDGVRILTDPLLRHRVGPLVRIAPSVSAELSSEIDVVLLSHLHADHADIRSLRSVASSTHVLAPMGAGRWLTRRGLRNVEEMGPGQETSVGAVRVTATPALHDGRRWRFGAQADPIGFIASGSQSCYFAGDTDLFGAMSEMAGWIDVALLPISGWGRTVGPGHLDPERSATAAARISPRVAVPIHWGTLSLALPARRPTDPRRPARRFTELVARDAPSVEVRVLEPGERTELESDCVAGRSSGEGG
jgi:L-ascorbate metabolism protein UlaG (beta-lactamase superfamily)